MTLRQKQSLFAQDFAKLIQYAKKQGYAVTLNEVYRPSIYQKLLIKLGRSWTRKSQHALKLAGDLNLFKDGKYLANSSDYRVLGRFWESLSSYNMWGGRFHDGDHFERRHDYPRKVLRGGKYARDL